MTRDTTTDDGRTTERRLVRPTAVLTRARWATRQLPATRGRDGRARTGRRRIARLLDRSSHGHLHTAHIQMSVWTDPLSYLVLADLFTWIDRSAAGDDSSTPATAPGERSPPPTRSLRDRDESPRTERRHWISAGGRLVTQTVERTIRQSLGETDSNVSPAVVAGQSAPQGDETRAQEAKRRSGVSAADESDARTAWRDISVRSATTTIHRIRDIGQRSRWSPRVGSRSVRDLDDRPALVDRSGDFPGGSSRLGGPAAAAPSGESGPTRYERGISITGGRRVRTARVDGAHDETTGRRVGRTRVGQAVGPFDDTPAFGGGGDPRVDPPLLVAQSQANGSDDDVRLNGDTPTLRATGTQASAGVGGRSLTGKSALGDDPPTDDSPTADTVTESLSATAVDRIVGRLERARRIARERGGRP